LGQKIPDIDKDAQEQIEEGLARSLEHAMSRLESADRKNLLATTGTMMQDEKKIVCDAVDHAVETPSPFEPHISEKKLEEGDADVGAAVDPATSQAQGADEEGMSESLDNANSRAGTVDEATSHVEWASDLAPEQCAVVQECDAASKPEVAREPDPILDSGIGQVGADDDSPAIADISTAVTADTSPVQVEQEDVLCSSTGILLRGANDGLQQKVTKAFEASTLQLGIPMSEEAVRHMTQSFLENMSKVLQEELRSMFQR